MARPRDFVQTTLLGVRQIRRGAFGVHAHHHVIGAE